MQLAYYPNKGIYLAGCIQVTCRKSLRHIYILTSSMLAQHQQLGMSSVCINCNLCVESCPALRRVAVLEEKLSELLSQVHGKFSEIESWTEKTAKVAFEGLEAANKARNAALLANDIAAHARGLAREAKDAVTEESDFDPDDFMLIDNEAEEVTEEEEFEQEEEEFQQEEGEVEVIDLTGTDATM